MTEKDFKVFISPGHGGSELGAQRDGFTESAFVFQWCKELERVLRATLRCQTLLSRSFHENPSLAARGRAAHDFDADIALSVHVNACHDTSIHGGMFFVRKDDVVSKTLALKMAALWPPDFERRTMMYEAENGPGPHDDWLQRPLNVLEPYRDIPTVLLELFFCSNERDRMKSTIWWNVEAMRVAVVVALADFWRNRKLSIDLRPC